MPHLFKKICFLFLLTRPCLLYGKPTLDISGNQKTKSEVIQREFELAIQNQEQDLLQSFEKRLKRMQIFSSIQIQKKNTDDYFLQVEEKWTTIPIVKIATGGGVVQTTLGVYDPNLFGSFIESGAQYEQLGSEGSGVFWLKNPRFLNRDQLLDFQYWNTKRLRLKYDQTDIDPKEKQGFILKRERFYLGFEPRLGLNTTFRISLDQSRDEFNESDLSDDLRRKFRGQKRPPDVDVTQVGLGIDWGALDWNVHLMEGTKISVLVKYHWVKNQVADPFYQSEVSFIYASMINQEINFAQRFLVGTTDTDLLQYWNYFGGLDRIRGFIDNRFSGRHYFLSNSELRRTMMEKSSWITQGTVFTDLLSAVEKTNDIDRISSGSMGLGVRIIFPKIYRAVLRFDYAKPLIKSDNQNLSFGLQQFF
ncbi:MAG: BamA/TamA family outer membrane protein [Pseudobdellovibrionaceae bacterium]